MYTRLAICRHVYAYVKKILFYLRKGIVDELAHEIVTFKKKHVCWWSGQKKLFTMCIYIGYLTCSVTTAMKQ